MTSPAPLPDPKTVPDHKAYTSVGPGGASRVGCGTCLQQGVQGSHWPCPPMQAKHTIDCALVGRRTYLEGCTCGASS